MSARDKIQHLKDKLCLDGLPPFIAPLLNDLAGAIDTNFDALLDDLILGALKRMALMVAGLSVAMMVGMTAMTARTGATVALAVDTLGALSLLRRPRVFLEWLALHLEPELPY